MGEHLVQSMKQTNVVEEDIYFGQTRLSKEVVFDLARYQGTFQTDNGLSM